MHIGVNSVNGKKFLGDTGSYNTAIGTSGTHTTAIGTTGSSNTVIGKINIKKGLDSASFMWYITYVGYAYEYININPIESMG